MSHEQDDNPYQEGKRAGAHPLLVVFGVILALWGLIYLYVPSGKQKPGAAAPDRIPTPAEDADTAPVIFKVGGTVPEFNAITVLVPPQATESQVIGLLKRFRDARLANTLTNMLPATTPGHKLGEHAVAEVFVFSDPQYARPEAVSVLARGAHAPGDLYPQAVQFEVAMEHVRGHYRIDLNDTGHPDQASLGFADESGVHSRNFRRLF
jgi:hypothetical protein